ncbi:MULTISPECIES: lipocalin-like domain-containing protein [Vibrio]|uniref:AttH domain-containing protein n=1 Tax=Vibrio halioticoli NBRC 102217 TaxID=1219072 RepID=V5HH85_9VIBR|nr:MULTISPECIES: lipocalin-like domain-containing protein [Vibrio]MPW35647.1 carotenoid 1,2-hydratase [Vibrio sp. B1Z05]GAD88780.1 hypothetical protein VHA01S_010_00040 [Vibrio halioticoli NBRC 102217]
MRNVFKKRLILLLAGLLVIVVIAGLITRYHLGQKQAHLEQLEKIAEDAQSTFEPVLPNKKVSFPQDFTVHPTYEQEVWRFIATVKDEQGNPYLVQWFLFRIAMSEIQGVSWESPQIYTSQAIVTTPNQIFLDQRFARGGIGLVGIRQRPYQLSIDNWSIRSFSEQPIPGRISVFTDQFKVNLTTELIRPYVPLGQNGYQVTHDLASRALYGYTAPYIRTFGVITVGNKNIKVAGQASFSQIWGTDILGKGQSGYSHMLFRLQDGRVLSLVKSRHQDEVQPYSFGNLYTPDGQHVALTNEDVEIRSVGTTTLSNGKILPLQWVINVPKYNIHLTAHSNRYDQWANLSIPSWSGRIQTNGNIKAEGYLQLVGY